MLLSHSEFWVIMLACAIVLAIPALAWVLDAVSDNRERSYPLD